MAFQVITYNTVFRRRRHAARDGLAACRQYCRQLTADEAAQRDSARSGAPMRASANATKSGLRHFTSSIPYWVILASRDTYQTIEWLDFFLVRSSRPQEESLYFYRCFSHVSSMAPSLSEIRQAKR